MTDRNMNGEADPTVEIDAGQVIDLLLNHDNLLVREAAKAAYWQTIAAARTEQVKELSATEG